jgi:hypothetical protein
MQKNLLIESNRRMRNGLSDLKKVVKDKEIEN